MNDYEVVNKFRAMLHTEGDSIFCKVLFDRNWNRILTLSLTSRIFNLQLTIFQKRCFSWKLIICWNGSALAVLFSFDRLLLEPAYLHAWLESLVTACGRSSVKWSLLLPLTFPPKIWSAKLLNPRFLPFRSFVNITRHQVWAQHWACEIPSLMRDIIASVIRWILSWEEYFISQEPYPWIFRHSISDYTGALWQNFLKP